MSTGVFICIKLVDSQAFVTFTKDNIATNVSGHYFHHEARVLQVQTVQLGRLGDNI
jgi:hypothetical protein